MIHNINDAVSLNNGINMPCFGLGTYLSEPGEVEKAVLYALETGYRSVDTAKLYRNEKNIGNALRQSGLRREEIFLTSKVWNSDQGYEKTLKAFEKSLNELETDYLDLYLIHWPVKGKFVDTWHALEKIYSDGRVRAIGVCNFLTHHLDKLISHSEIIPAVNQYEFHPLLQQKTLHEYCRKRGIQVEAWAPVMRGKAGNIPELMNIARNYDKSPEQVLLRWDLQQNVITIPKSVHKNRIKENAEIFDFELSNEDMEKIYAMDKNKRLGPNPDHVYF